METASNITGLRKRKGWHVASAAMLVSAVLGTSAAPAHADDDGHGRVTVTQTNLVANRDGYGAAIVDADLLNAWGMSKFPTSPVWVSNNHSDSSTLYTGGSAAAPTGVSKIPLTVSVASPTGQVANATDGFKLLNGSASRFIFDTEDGLIFAWNQSSGTTAEQVQMVPGANFKGLAQGTVDTATFLYAADFANGRIVVLDDAWNVVDWSGAFHVRHLPAGLSPFNVQVLRDAAGAEHVYVAYAKLDPATGDEVTGQGLGLVAEFTTDGTFVRRFASKSMNAPWGLAYAPASWGRAAGDLLVGQFGNGRIEMFNPRNGKHTGTVRDDQGHKLAIDGLWALMAGDATSGGVDTVLFTAGPNEEEDGLYGVLTFVARSHHEDDD
ncbi:MAG: TIGR03118 family protein [Ilumatobacteraceae bacterium]|nr:TIGR03118 family protein [Ilumatobacteraceae bacterium]